MEPVISIIIPVHNSEKYLRECLDSVLAQDFDAFEVLIINDHSTDKSEIICNKYADNGNNIRILKTKKNGVSAARNVGIENARGEWITFVDSDDIISENYCSSLFAATKQNIDLVIARTISFKGNTSNQLDDGFNAKLVTDFKTTTQKKELVKSIFVDNKKEMNYPHISTCSAKLFRTNLVKDMRYDDSLKVYEDAVFNIEVIYASNTVRLIDQKIYYYRQNDHSATKRFSKAIVGDYEKSCRALEELEKNYGIGYSENEGYFAIKNLNTILRAYYGANNNNKYLKEIVKREPYRGAIKKINIKTLPAKRAAIILLMKARLFFLVGWMYRRLT